MDSELRASDPQSTTKKFQRYADKFRTEPFLNLLANNERVRERDAMRAYGFTPVTKSWSAKLSLIATKARRELGQHGITLARAAIGKGWSLPPSDRQKLKSILDHQQPN